MYETGINPFTEFSQRERQRKYKELTVVEKITLSTTRSVLRNKFARYVRVPSPPPFPRS